MATTEPAFSSTPTYIALVDAVSAGAIAMIGAGTSARLGYPGWMTLLERLGSEAQQLSPSHPALKATSTLQDDVLIRAESCEEILGSEKVGAIVAEVFAPRSVPFDAFHETLVSIPFLHMLTTNYEFVLESAQEKVHGKSSYTTFDFDQSDPRGKFLQSITAPNALRHIVHLHGSIHRPNSIVLTLRQYRERYARRSDAQFVLQSIFAQCRIVFIGFGLTDPYFMKLLDELAAYLGDKPQPRHFALLASEGDAADEGRRYKLETQYGICPLFYDPKDNRKQLEDILTQLRHDVDEISQRRKQQQLESLISPLFADVDGKAVFTLAQIMERVSSRHSEGPVRLSTSTSRTQTLTDTSSPERTKLDAEIDSIFGYVRGGKADTAIALYTAILDHRTAELNDRLRYRLHANRGHALLSLGNNSEAANEYSLAFGFQSSSKDAKAMEALAYTLRGDVQTAHTKAEILCREEPDFPRAHAIRLRALPRGTDFRSALRTVPRALKRNAEIAQALSGLASETNRLRHAELYASVAANSEPQWSDAWIMLGTAILIRERNRATFDVDRGLIPVDTEHVQKAGEAFDRALAILAGSANSRPKALALFNRASVKHLLGDIPGCHDDLQKAFNETPEDSDFAARLALTFEQRNDFASAIHILERFDPSNCCPSIHFVLALTLFRRRADGDADRSASLLTSLIKTFGLHDSKIAASSRIDRIGLGGLPDILQLYTTVQIARGHQVEALELLQQISDQSLPAGLLSAHKARLTFRSNEPTTRETGVAIIRDAVNQADGNVDQYATREIAAIAEFFGEHAGAFRLLRKFVHPTRFNSEVGFFLRCAHHAQEHSFVLEFCRKLRSEGIWERESVAIEINTLLSHHELSAAIDLIQAWLKRQPDDKVIRATLSSIGIQREDRELIESNPINLPSSEEVPDAQAGATIVTLLSHTSDPPEAVRFAYRLWRRFPDDETAQHVLICNALQPGNSKAALYNPESVDLWSAVTVQESGAPESYVFVVEDGPNPRATLDELDRNHSLVKLAWGRGVGEEFVNPATGRQTRIVAIENKIIHRVRLCMKSFEKAFQESQLFRTFHLPSDVPAGTDPKKYLGEVWEVLHADETRRNYLVSLYQQMAIPVSQLARVLKRSVLDTFGHLASQQGVGILVSAGFEQERKVTAAALEHQTKVVLDETAIATLFLLNLDKELERLPFTCVIAERAIDEIRASRRELANPALGGYLGLDNGRVVFREVSAEQRQERFQRLDTLLQALLKNCEIVGGAASLSLPAELRKQLPDYIGPACIDALAIARERKLLLWSDDFITGAHIAHALGVQRTWSQPMLEFASLRNPELRDRLDPCIPQLFLHGYQILRLSITAVVSLLEGTNWSLDHWITQRVISYIALMTSLGGTNCRVSQLLVNSIWQRCNEKKAQVMIRAILNAIGRPIAGPYVARPIYRAGLHPPHKEGRKWNQLKRFLRRWRSAR